LARLPSLLRATRIFYTSPFRPGSVSSFAAYPDRLLAVLRQGFTYWFVYTAHDELQILVRDGTQPRTYLSKGYPERSAAQVMLELCSWVTGALERPLGRGINFMIYVESLDPLLDALAAANWPLFRPSKESRHRMGEQEIGQREFLVQDPDGYLLRFADAHSHAEAPRDGGEHD
jgi:hypothetical protein